MSIPCLKLLPNTIRINSKILDTVAKVTTLPLALTHTTSLAFFQFLRTNTPPMLLSTQGFLAQRPLLSRSFHSNWGEREEKETW